eukprot:TRINITY_DN63461_c0_g1_i1.p1 TRINITY_DN63461_c0_g1~~TRINITY_DN63461_c0_g1_i1.p1  ORF type:complete len:114 (-),score=21.80 TRINITY_DN63461_c0_g1_i1:68-409(-)
MRFAAHQAEKQEKTARAGPAAGPGAGAKAATGTAAAKPQPKPSPPQPTTQPRPPRQPTTQQHHNHRNQPHNQGFLGSNNFSKSRIAKTEFLQRSICNLALLPILHHDGYICLM